MAQNSEFGLLQVSSTALFAVSSVFSLLWLHHNNKNNNNNNNSKKHLPVSVSHVIRYPIKGCRGLECTENEGAKVTQSGILGDREYAVVVLQGDSTCLNLQRTATIRVCKALSQARAPKLSLVTPLSITSDATITVSAPDMENFVHRAITVGERYSIDFWGDVIEAVDQGDVPAEWFSRYLGMTVRFVRLDPGMHRMDAAGTIKETSIFYRTPILLISEESMRDLSGKVGQHLSHDRFRANIVVSGSSVPYAEDATKSIQIGGVLLTGTEMCERCSIPAINPSNGQLDTALLAQLRESRSPKNMTTAAVHATYRGPNMLKDQHYYLGVYYEPSVASSKTTVVNRQGDSVPSAVITVGQRVEFL